MLKISNLIIIVFSFFCIQILHAESFVDEIIIKKSERKMYVVIDGQISYTFNIALGKNPIGHKRFEGDKKTPEGTYFIDSKIDDSYYFRSLHLSYPNIRDKKYAEGYGKSAGSNITIHGTPNSLRDYSRHLFDGADWTNGCIAINNSQLRKLWKITRLNTPVTIQP